MLKHVMVTLDGSQLSAVALDFAREIVAPSGVLTFLSIVDVPDFPMYDFYPAPITVSDKDYTNVMEDMLTKTREYLEKLAEPYREQGFLVKIITKVGEPASVIVEQAEKLGVDAIVMSTHGRSGFSRWLFGSVTQKVLSAMPCPVFVVPGGKVSHKQEETPEEAVHA